MRTLLFLSLALAACDAGQIEPDPDALRVAEVVLARADGSVAAYSHDDHWHGTLRATVGTPTELDVWLVTAAAPGLGHDVPPRESWVRPSAREGVSVRVTSDDTAVATWSASGDTATLTASAAGAVLTTVVVLDGSTTRYQSPPAATITSEPATAGAAPPAAAPPAAAPPAAAPPSAVR